MMRRPFSLLALICAALMSCLVGGFFFIRTFQAGDCDGGCNLYTLASIVSAAFAAFLSAGYVLMKRREAKGESPYPALIALSAAVLAVPGLMLAVKGMLPAGPLKTNQDDSYMLVAKRDVPGIGIATGDRCIFSRIDCSATPARIDAVCTRGAITLEESQWSAFARQPREDFGIPPDGAVQAFPRSCPKR
ncbi:hypothetical protein [Paracidovorax cattleyae]|uniref:Uncharacterized protein n=1 Tax=Paracidovorax cattleyae TaxID=80868 RepID=A0A1H0WR29_9BURK|nr:hypothetical protein [Paracidovorax cattleyae]AVS75797.1 hypothetical protein C8240_19020 [Paracidovorax cattleyae]SDP93150.1 hypothetical protein SAMN04489708_1493 [Paracidovorax cattleyae]